MSSGGPGEVGPAGGLRERILASATHVAGRQAAGAVLRLAGAVAVTGLIGPAAFGGYAGAVAVVGLVALVAALGVDVFLLRRADGPGREVEDQAASLLAASAAGATGLGLLAATLAGPLVLDDALVGPLQVLLLTVPLTLLAFPARCRLERALEHRRLVRIELAGELLFYVVAVALALAGSGAWAPVGGFAAQQLAVLAGWSRAAGYRPRWRWSRPGVAELLRYGLGQSASVWALRSQDLVNPVVVGGLLGPAAVGNVALALRILDTVSLLKAAATRLGIVAIARAQDSRERLARVHAEGTALQLMVLGPLLAGFALVSPWVVPRVFGDGWDDVVALFPLLAATTLIGTLANLESAALQVAGRSRALLVVRGTTVAVFVAAALVTVPWLGVVGFGVAQLTKSVGVPLAHRAVRPLFVPSYRRALPWLAAWLPPLAGAWVAAPVAMVLLVPAAAVVMRSALRGDLRDLGRVAAGWAAARRVA